MTVKTLSFTVLHFVFLLPLLSHSSRVVGQPAASDIDPHNFDVHTSPGMDFFQYSNGIWLQTHDIPPTEGWWGDARISEKGNYLKVRHMLETAATSSSDTMERLLATIYTSGMDTARVSRLGIAPVKKDLDRIAAIQNRMDVLVEIAVEHTNGLGRAFNLYCAPDQQNSTRTIVYFNQGGLGLYRRSIYLNHDPETEKTTSAYRTYMQKLLELTGVPSDKAARSAEGVWNLETALAKGSKSASELRQVRDNYHKFALKDLSGKFPGIDWALWIKTLRLPADSVVISQPAFFEALSNELTKTPVETWKDYLKIHFLDNVAIFLDNDFSEAHFQFRGRIWNGQTERAQRWEEVADLINEILPDAIGYCYVKDYFPPSAKSRAREMTKNIGQAFQRRIEQLSWMTPHTKEIAIAKLNAIMWKIGYPDQWTSYASLRLDPSSYYANVVAVSQFNYAKMVRHYNDPVDKKVWLITPPTVNAYYEATANEIVLPAGILQFPFFDPAADDAFNYGGIGVVIGHELTHGFDDQGKQFDLSGNLSNWWTGDDEIKFKEIAAKVVALYDTCTVLDSLKVNGKLTLGENIADLGGLAIAYDALMQTTQFRENKKIDGFTPAQRFFLSYSQCRRRKMRPSYLKNFILTDPHSPPSVRVNIPLANFDPFYEAFAVRPEDKMFIAPNARVHIW